MCSMLGFGGEQDRRKETIHEINPLGIRELRTSVNGVVNDMHVCW